MFPVVFALVFVTAHVTALVTRDIPSYINVCSRTDPKLDECITDNIKNLRQKICEGMEDLHVPGIERLHIDEIVIASTESAKLYARNADVIGLCTYVVDHLHADIDTLHFEVKVSFDRLRLNSTYDFDIRVLVPILANGNIFIVGDKVYANIIFDMTKTIKDGKTYVYISKGKLDLNVKDFDIKFADNGNAEQLQEIINNFIGNNQEEMFKTVKPALEEAVVKVLISIGNEILKHWTYDELFLE